MRSLSIFKLKKERSIYSKDNQKIVDVHSTDKR